MRGGVGEIENTRGGGGLPQQCIMMLREPMHELGGARHSHTIELACGCDSTGSQGNFKLGWREWQCSKLSHWHG
jgi:hypothetical protein